MNVCPAYERTGGRKTGRIVTLPPPLSSWTTSRDLPRPPAQTFREWWAKEHGRGLAPARESRVQDAARPERGIQDSAGAPVDTPEAGR